MRNKKKNKIILLIILILGISIGFALLSTTLKINGTTGISKNEWNIYWANVGNELGVTPVSETVITDEDTEHKKNTVNFEVKFDKPGDYYEFQVDAVNAGTLNAIITKIESRYDGTLIPTTGTSPLPPYIKYEVKYADDTLPEIGDILEKRVDNTHFTSKRYKIRVEYDKNSVEPSDVNNQNGDVTHSFDFEVTYDQYIIPEASDFSTDSWDTIAKEGNRAATQTSLSNNKCGKYTVGDTKTVNMGTLGVHTVRIANCSTPAVCSTEGFSQTACGFVLEFTDIILERSFSTDNYGDTTIGVNTYGGWKYSDMRAYLNGTTYEYNGTNYASSSFLSRLPVKLQRQLGSTTVVSGINRYDSSDNAVTTDKLFLLAPHEVWESNIDDSSWNLTRQLDYYSINETTLSNPTAAVKHMGNSAPYWWLRSADYYSERNYYGVRDNGDYDGSTPAHQDGVSPAFKLK